MAATPMDEDTPPPPPQSHPLLPHPPPPPPPPRFNTWQATRMQWYLELLSHPRLAAFMSVKPHFDKYDVAGVFVYLLRAKLPRSLYEPDTFFLAAYLLNHAGLPQREQRSAVCALPHQPLCRGRPVGQGSREGEWVNGEKRKKKKQLF
eukprot:m.74137 g.74137  ORF g.74137 m.74137 type:complete len:148 (-) comp14488_c2_seq4:795-1238(-)